ncbi:MAG: multiheme c-type cytochrome [Pirellulaceae bacterium]
MHRQIIPLLLAGAICLGSGCREPVERGGDGTGGGGGDPRPAAMPPASSSVPPSSGPAASPFRNAAAGVAYVGNDACQECHENEFASYLHTSHSRALRLVQPAEESVPVEFFHTRSGRTYRASIEGDAMWHEESVRLEDGTRVVLARHPMKYVMGSGNHSRSYLAEIDGFLVESPMTWYRSQNAWHMSPGYDRPVHSGFQRTADVGCVNCHAGRVEFQAADSLRVKLGQLAIGCENCHGPGRLHVDKHARGAANGSRVPAAASGDDGGKGSEKASEPSRAAVAGSDAPHDETIVNPRRLPRDLAEAVCAQCHLRGDATTVLQHRTILDYRPGHRLTDSRVDYFHSRPDHGMKVVGHVEQMRASRCFQASADLRCTTCHDVHSEAAPVDPIAYFRERCVACHSEPQSVCAVSLERRVAQAGADDCVQCHMPRQGTDIVHFAFTHHRIGIHASGETTTASRTEEVGQLVPFYDLSHLSEDERQRSLGLACIEWSVKQGASASGDHYRREAQRLLQPLGNRQDAVVKAALARLAWESGDGLMAQSHAVEALRLPAPLPESNALVVAGHAYLEQGDVRAALPLFERLVQLRRACDDWIALGTCQHLLGNHSASRESLERALAIDPTRVSLQQELIRLHEVEGRISQAAEGRLRLQALLQLRRVLADQ